ncbi:MAG: surface lipoprotein assembly modifier [Pseudomonadota bacterium]
MPVCARFRGVRHSAGAAALFAGMLLALASPVWAVSDAEIVSLIARGQTEAARRLYATTDPTAIDWLFFAGRVAKAAGRFEEAAETFREVLRRDPSYINAKRELAHTLLLGEDYRISAHHFRELLRRDPEPAFRPGYVHFLQEIDRLRPLSISGHLAIIGSSNVNRGSSEAEFRPGIPNVPSFGITSQAEPGHGLEAGVSGRYRWAGEGAYRWTLGWGLVGRKFDQSIHDSATLSTRIRFGRLSERTRWSAGPFLRATWAADEDHNVAVGLGVSFDRRLTRNTTLFFNGSTERRRYLNEDGLDGPSHLFQAGLARALPLGSVSVGSRLRFHQPETEHQRYTERALFTRLSRSWRGGLHGSIGLEVGQRSYAADFPLAGHARQDDFYRVNLSARHDTIHFGRFTPLMNCTFGNTESNIAFFEHSVDECIIGVTTRF